MLATHPLTQPAQSASLRCFEIEVKHVEETVQGKLPLMHSISDSEIVLCTPIAIQKELIHASGNSLLLIPSFLHLQNG